MDENCDGDTTLRWTQTFYADSDADGYENVSLSIAFAAHRRFVDNGDDCNDTDSGVQPFMPQRGGCATARLTAVASLESLGEVDLDRDGYVTCDLGVDPLLWEDLPSSRWVVGIVTTATPIGTGATELCSSIFEL